MGPGKLNHLSSSLISHAASDVIRPHDVLPLPVVDGSTFLCTGSAGGCPKYGHQLGQQVSAHTWPTAEILLYPQHHACWPLAGATSDGLLGNCMQDVCINESKCLGTVVTACTPIDNLAHLDSVLGIPMLVAPQCCRYFDAGQLELTTLGNFGRVSLAHSNDGPASLASTATGGNQQ